MKLLILSASVGGGHVAAANALFEAATMLSIEATHVDILKTLPKATQVLFRDVYFDLVKTAPDLVNWLGDLTDKHPSEKKALLRHGMARLSRVLLSQIPKVVRDNNPDVLINTHFVAPAVLSAEHPMVPEAVVITDYEAHNFWLQRGVGRYFVATEEMAVHLRHSGVSSERIEVTGIPIAKAYANLAPKETARKALGLPQNKGIILFNASGLAKAALIFLLKDLMTLRVPLTVVVTCGRSEENLLIVRQETADYEGPLSFTIVGISKDMPSLMAAADLLVGKPGGLTTTEALAAGLPFAVVDPYPVQEEANLRFLLESGAAFAVQPLSVFAFKLKRFFEDPARREAMRKAAAKMAKPQAATDILSSLGERPMP